MDAYRVSARALILASADCFRVLLPIGSRRALALVRCQGIGLGSLDAANDAEGIERRRGLRLVLVFVLVTAASFCLERFRHSGVDDLRSAREDAFQ